VDSECDDPLRGRQSVEAERFERVEGTQMGMNASEVSLIHKAMLASEGVS
jgi:hypothetical protein